MIIDSFNILDHKKLDEIKPDAICFTSNGFVKKNGALTMGAGTAGLFNMMFKGLALNAGKMVKENGNICQIVGSFKVDKHTIDILAFPTKHSWSDKTSDMELINSSLIQLQKIADEKNWSKILLPYPGISNGRLDEEVVYESIKVLDDRFVILKFNEK